MLLRLIGIGCGLAAANYLYQAWSDGDWIIATERSFFQATAIFAVWVAFALSDWCSR